ncbi:MAG: hypothetical protein Q9185_006006 [Variospora sp. 1 TL-2023]
MSTTTPPPQKAPNYPTTPFRPPAPGSPYPYTPASFTRLDSTPDSSFYSTPRFVTHIDDAAIARLRTYYAHNLPSRGRILDLCSSWVSHFPPSLEAAAAAKHTTTTQGGEKDNDDNNSGRGRERERGGEGNGLEVLGLGISSAELAANPLLHVRIPHDLNTSPSLPASSIGEGLLDATVCVVSIDYLTQPVEVLKSVLERTKQGGKLHLVISNRCFPTKVVGPWLRLGERERLELVAGYVWWAGWRGVEIVDVVEEEGDQREEGVMGKVRGWVGRGGGRGGGGDPLWVVRGVKTIEGERHEEL